MHRQPFDGHTLTGEPLRYRFVRGASGPFGEDLPVPYLSREQAIEAYRGVFAQYRRYGDESPLRASRWGRVQLKAAAHYYRLVKRQSLSGWYDTHAALA